MTKRISELPAAAALSDADEFELNQGGASRKATHAQIVAGLASAAHQHTLADITDSGALAALDSVGTTQIDAAAFASGAEAIAGIDNAKIMTPLRTAEAVATLPPAPHQHTLVEITDSGALAGLDTVGTAELDDAAYASQPEAIAGTDNSKIMTALRTAQAIAALAPEHQHTLSDVTDAGALAALDLVGPGEIEPNAVTSGKIFAGAVGTDKLADHAVIASKLATDAVASSNIASGAVTEAKIADDAISQSKIAANAYASQAEATAGTDNAKLMTALRTAQAIAALATEHQHTLADVTDAGTLAALDLVGVGEIAPNAVNGGKIAAGAVGTDKLAEQAVTATKLASNAVTEAKIASAAVTEAKIADGAVGASKLQPGIPIDMQDAVLTAPELRDYSETSPSPAILAGTLILDLETGNVFQVTLTQNVTSLILAHPPAANRAGSCSLIVRQDGTGGRSLAWNGAIKWPGGTPPAVTSAANAVDVYSLVTRDGGVTWYGFLGGQDFS
jgi:hypothetical protein